MREILITEQIEGPAVDALSRSFNVLYLPDLWKDPSALKRHVVQIRGLIVRNQTMVDAALLNAATTLIVIGRADVGLDNVDVAHATRNGVLVTSTPDQNAISVAELAIGLMLSLAARSRTRPQTRATATGAGNDSSAQSFMARRWVSSASARSASSPRGGRRRSA